MQNKVIVDTNVLVSASIQFSVKESKMEVKHRFYDQSWQLFELFRNNLAKRIGIITRTVEVESFGVLLKALGDIIKEEIADINERRKIFETLRTIADLCENKMRRLVGYLFTEQVEEKEVNEKLHFIKDMCLVISQLQKRYHDPDSREIEAWKLHTRVPNPTNWPKHLRKEVLDIYKEKVVVEKIQLDRFGKGPGEMDMRILAESAYLCEYYKSNFEDGVRVYLASCDTKFFSPYRKENIESRIVTDEIQQRFNVICDWPYQIAKEVRNNLKGTT